MPEVALIPASQDLYAAPFRSGLSGSSGLFLLLMTAMVVLLLAVEAMIAAARVLLEPVFVLIRKLFWLLFVLGAAMAIVLLLVAGSAHAAGRADAGAGLCSVGGGV